MACKGNSKLEFAEGLAPKLLEYLASLEKEAWAADRAVAGAAAGAAVAAAGPPPVVLLRAPDELEAAFVGEAGVDLSFAGPAANKPHATAALLAAADAILKYSVRTGSPQFNNQLYGAADSVGIAGEWLAAALNTNVHTYEVAPVFTLMEKAVLAKFANAIGAPYSEPTPVEAAATGTGAASLATGGHEGLMVPGGSIANMYGMQLARFTAWPETKEYGNSCPSLGGRRLVAFTSAEAHYSYLKSANVMGLGTANLIKVCAHVTVLSCSCRMMIPACVCLNTPFVLPPLPPSPPNLPRSRLPATRRARWTPLRWTQRSRRRALRGAARFPSS